MFTELDFFLRESTVEHRTSNTEHRTPNTELDFFLRESTVEHRGNKYSVEHYMALSRV